jgi:hypothetical protein
MFKYEHLCDLHILFRLTCIFPLLESMHALIKFAQFINVFVLDLVATVEVCQGDVYNTYYDQTFNFIANSFCAFKLLSS